MTPPLATSGLLLATVDHDVQEKGVLRRRCFDQPSPLAGLKAFFTQLVDDALQGSCLLTRTLMELAEQDEELHLRFKVIYGELESDLAQLLRQASERESWPPGGHPHPDRLLAGQHPGAGDLRRATPTAPCWTQSSIS